MLHQRQPIELQVKEKVRPLSNYPRPRGDTSRPDYRSARSGIDQWAGVRLALTVMIRLPRRIERIVAPHRDAYIVVILIVENPLSLAFGALAV